MPFPPEKKNREYTAHVRCFALTKIALIRPTNTIAKFKCGPFGESMCSQTILSQF